MLTMLRRYVIRSRFKAMVKAFDDKIEAARAAHQPVQHLIAAKRAFVHEKLEGASRGRTEHQEPLAGPCPLTPHGEHGPVTAAAQQLADFLAEKPKRKYRNTPVVVDGVNFASRKEGRRFAELKLMERAGQIKDLMIQPRYPLRVNGMLVCTYVGDFAYRTATEGVLIVEDTKGFRTREYINKAKLFHALHGFPVTEV